MNSEQAKAINGFVVIDILEIKPQTGGINLINPHTNKAVGTRESYAEHPFQALVVKCPKVFHNGGIEYPSEIKEGDVALLGGFPIPERTMVVNIEGKNYPIIRYAEIPLHYTPTPEQRAGFKFAMDMFTDEVKENNPATVITDRPIGNKKEDVTPKQEITD